MSKKYAIGSLIIILLVLGSFIIIKRKIMRSSGGLTIGIIQTASHPALDAVGNSFMQEIKSALGNGVNFVHHNAQGSVANAHTIAQSFHADPTITAIFAIATPALQAMASVEKEKPIFFAAITDPKKLGVMHPNTNVCGSSDMINVPETIALIKELIPQAKTVALIYNNAEQNSVTMAQLMTQELQKKGLIPSDSSFTSEADVPAAIQSVLQKVDVLLAPTDNTVASTITFIATQALQAKKPLIVSDNLLVSHGALAARGIDYATNGRQAAQLAIAVLKEGKKPSELPIVYATNSKIVINKTTLHALGLTVPESLKNHVTLVE